MLFDPLDGKLLDPAGGLADLRSGRLMAVDLDRFSEDPLRPGRVAQLAARLEYAVDPALLSICRTISLADLPPARLWVEWVKMMLRGQRPSNPVNPQILA